MHSSAQQYADTLPGTRNVLLEEFTAVHCFFCPAGHALMDSLITAHPGRVFGTAMHPANTSYTEPYAGSQDFRSTYANAFFSIPFATDSVKFFPGAFINRRQWDDERRLQYTQLWRAYTDSILSKPSPMNIGLHTVYDLSAAQLSVDVEVYYTGTATFPQTLYVYITEDSLVAEQNNGGVNYLHNHIFRQSLVTQWGDTLISTGLPGTLYSTSFSFDNNVTAYQMLHSHIIAFVRNAATGEIMTVQSVPVENFTTGTSEKPSEPTGFRVFPNPFNDMITLEGLVMADEAISYTLYNLQGNNLLNGTLNSEHSGKQSWRIPIPVTFRSFCFILEIRSSGGVQHFSLLRF